VDIAQDIVGEFAAVKTQLLNEADDLDVARDAAEELISLKNGLNSESEDVLDAQQVAEDLYILKNTIVEHGGNSETAFENTDRLFTLRDTLNSDMDLNSAENNLGRLVVLQDTLNGQTREVADALETLEVLTDLGEELQGQVAVLGEMRKSLLDIVLMESTIRKVATVLEPLAELYNVRRMGKSELREAARTVIENRSSRIAGRSVESTRTASENLKIDSLESLTSERPVDVLVPMPRDIKTATEIDTIE